MQLRSLRHFAQSVTTMPLASLKVASAPQAATHGGVSHWLHWTGVKSDRGVPCWLPSSTRILVLKCFYAVSLWALQAMTQAWQPVQRLRSMTIVHFGLVVAWLTMGAREAARATPMLPWRKRRRRGCSG